jgi:hypothetical protein
VSVDDVMLARSAYRGALLAAVLNVAGTPVELVIAAEIPDFPRWAPIATSLIGALVAALLVVRRHTVTVRFASRAFVVNSAAVVVMLWIVHPYLAHTVGFSPFLATKLGAVASGFLAPSRWSGVIAIVGFAGSASVQHLLFDPERTAGEPWTTLVYGAAGLALLFHLQHMRRMEREMVHARVEQRALEDLARRLMAMRDLANTPLQTIELTVGNLRERAPEHAAALDRIERALERLRGIRGFLSGLEDGERWSSGAESFDVRQQLARRGDGHVPDPCPRHRP